MNRFRRKGPLQHFQGPCVPTLKIKKKIQQPFKTPRKKFFRADPAVHYFRVKLILV